MSTRHRCLGAHQYDREPILILISAHHPLMHWYCMFTTSLVPRLSPREFSILQVTERWAWPGNEASLLPWWYCIQYKLHCPIVQDLLAMQDADIFSQWKKQVQLCPLRYTQNCKQSRKTIYSTMNGGPINSALCSSFSHFCSAHVRTTYLQGCF